VAGSAAFTDANTLSVCVDAATGLRRELTAKYGFVLATGAQPSLPTANIAGLADTPFVT
jgi:pyruvate/2-oxoglutarate dehydrogenase complex dihydrolipoamide dehydrogenase (E3) component